MSRRNPGLIRRRGAGGRVTWHIDKHIKGYGRLCESTGQDDEDEAARYLAKRVREIRDAIHYGVRPKRTFRAAAARYLNENAHRRGIRREADALAKLDRFIGEALLDEVCDESFDKYRSEYVHLSIDTVNRDIAAAKAVLGCAASKWRDETTKKTWLAQVPFIALRANPKRRKPYPLDWHEQRILFEELAPHLQRMALFKVNTGLRSKELAGLRWAWEVGVPELDTPAIKRSVFLLPSECTKNGEPRVVVLNDVAQSVLEEVRGQHSVYVFTYEDFRGKRDRLYSFRNTGWLKARERAAARYLKEFGRESPEGFRRVRVHDLRHTFGRRLRAADVSFEDRQDLLGHEAGRITTEYSAAEIGKLIEAANLVIKSRESPARTVLRVVSDSA